MTANFIGGAWSPAASGRTYTRVNPARPSETIGAFPSSGVEDVDAAVNAAAAAFAGWSALPAPKRGDILLRAAAAVERRSEELAADMTREMGKPIREARGEIARVSAIFRFFAGEGYRPLGEVFDQSGGGRVTTTRRPVGVVALITPWNFPAAIPAWKTAPALVFGNTVVIKPAQDAALTATHLAECLAEAGLPDGVLNVVLGPGSTVGTALVDHPRVAAVSFTGSVPTGHAIRNRATAAGKRVNCELGGQNPLIVAADADLARAAEAAYAGAFWSAGQKCTATRRIYVEAPAYDAFRALLLERVARGRVGDPSDPETEVGPIVSEPQLESIVAAIAQAEAEGGTRIAGGLRRDEGWYLEPTVFENVDDSSILSREEVFGPVVALYRYSDLGDAITRANAVSMGLSASVFTSSLATADRFSRELQAGILHVNSQTAGAEVHVPFGGIKASGWGPHEQGRAAIEFHTDVITIYHDN